MANTFGKKFIGNTLGDKHSFFGSHGPHDFFRGTSGHDRMNGKGGHDTLLGGDGHDRLHGGSGNDYLHGGSGNDTLYSGTGTDTLRGGQGHDHLFLGSSGAAAADLGSSANYTTAGYDADLEGGNGNDTYYVPLSFTEGGGFCTILDSGGNDTLKVIGVDVADVVFSRENGNLKLAMPDDAEVYINAFFQGGTGEHAGIGCIETLRFADAVLDFADVAAQLGAT